MLRIESVIRHRFFIGLISLAVGLFTLPTSTYAQEAGNIKSPVRLDRDMASGLGLDIFPWEDETRLAKWSTLFAGEELAVSIFESTPLAVTDGPAASRNRVRNYPYDQFVIVLSGKAILTDSEGLSQTFVAGDSFVVPMGFSGTWEDHGVYRELIVVMEEAMRTRTLDIEPDR